MVTKEQLNKQLNSKMWRKLIINEYCACKPEDREKITLTDDLGENCDMCLTCNKELKVEKDQTEEELDFSECEDLVEDDNNEYERDRYESQTEDRSSSFAGNY